MGGGVRTGAGSVNNGKIGCGVAGAPIASDDVVAVLRLWNAGRNVVEKKCIIISMSMNALVFFLKKRCQEPIGNTKKTEKKKPYRMGDGMLSNRTRARARNWGSCVPSRTLLVLAKVLVCQ